MKTKPAFLSESLLAIILFGGFLLAAFICFSTVRNAASHITETVRQTETDANNYAHYISHK